MEALVELSDLNRILLTLARSREFPDGSSRRGYDFIAPLDPLHGFRVVAVDPVTLSIALIKSFEVDIKV
jgi:hypothetical protein